MNTKTKKKILLVEDHPIFRLGLAELINQESDLTASGESKDVDSAIKEIESVNPDLIIADISLKNSDGIDLVRHVKKHHPRIPVLVLSMHDEYLYAQRALHAGAKGYIMKQEAMESVVAAIHHVLSGRVYLNDTVKDHILSNITGSADLRKKKSCRTAYRPGNAGIQTDRQRLLFQGNCHPFVSEHQNHRYVPGKNQDQTQS